MIGAGWEERQFREDRGDAPAEPERFRELMSVAGMPRSNAYDPVWVYLNQMGPNVLWLAESLAEKTEITPGMRVLDMGCGTAMSSIFLAREFGARVWATDLWIPASDNWRRIREANLEDKVFPIHAEAHTLPFADGFFDAAVSLDAFHYFGADDLYFAYFSRFVREGGSIGVVVPGNEREVDELPEDMRDFWGEVPWEFFSFHSPRWWERNWLRTGLVDIEAADMVPGGRELWLRWCDAGGAWEGKPDPYGERKTSSKRRPDRTSVSRGSSRTRKRVREIMRGCGRGKHDRRQKETPSDRPGLRPARRGISRRSVSIFREVSEGSSGILCAEDRFLGGEPA